MSYNIEKLFCEIDNMGIQLECKRIGIDEIKLKENLYTTLKDREHNKFMHTSNNCDDKENYAAERIVCIPFADKERSLYLKDKDLSELITKLDDITRPQQKDISRSLKRYENTQIISLKNKLNNNKLGVTYTP